MKKLLVIILFLCISFQSFGQVSGYKGQRFVLSADLIDVYKRMDIYSNLEFAVFRNTSLYLNFQFKEHSYEQYHDPFEMSNRTAIEEPALVKDMVAGLGIRFYRKRDVPAPLGHFAYIQYGIGSLDVDAIYAESRDFHNTMYEVSANNIFFTQSELGYGAQTIFFDRLVFTYQLGVVVTRLRPEAEVLETGLKSFAGSYGGNYSINSYNWGGGDGLFDQNSSINTSLRLIAGFSF